MKNILTIYFDGYQVETEYIDQQGILMIPALLLKHSGTTVDINSTDNSVLLTRNTIIFSYPAVFMEKHYIPLKLVAERLCMDVSYRLYSSEVYINTNESTNWQSQILYQGKTKKKKVALTFDDGPDNIYTPIILDILNKKSVPATFFVIGESVRFLPQTLKDIVKRGHSVGNHSWNHPKLPEITSSEVMEEIQSTNMEIESLTGEKTRLFRPPYGAFARADINTIQSLEFKVIMWSIDTLDWKGLSSEKIVSIIKREISPGTIILQHSFGVGSLLDGTVMALSKIIDDLHDKGYEFVRVEDLILENEK